MEIYANLWYVGCFLIFVWVGWVCFGFELRIYEISAVLRYEFMNNIMC